MNHIVKLFCRFDAALGEQALDAAHQAGQVEILLAQHVDGHGDQEHQALDHLLVLEEIPMMDIPLFSVPMIKAPIRAPPMVPVPP